MEEVASSKSLVVLGAHDLQYPPEIIHSLAFLRNINIFLMLPSNK